MTMYYSARAYEDAEPDYDDEPEDAQEDTADPDDYLTDDELDRAASEAESRWTA